MHNSTVLHLACYFRKWELAQKLFDSLSENAINKLCETKNEWGDTLLHEVSTSNKGIDMAHKLLRRKPDLLKVPNNAGETPIFRATRHGKLAMFEFLHMKLPNSNVPLNYYSDMFFTRQDGTTILHMAILTRNFDMALMIAEKYNDLHHRKAQNKWTALQYLACSLTAFKSGARFGVLKKLLYKCVSIDEEGHKAQLKTRIRKCCPTSPVIEEVTKMKKGHKDALQLSLVLIKSDTSSMETYQLSAEGSPNIDITSGNDVPVQKNGDPSEEEKKKKKKNYDDETLRNKQAEYEYESDILDSSEAPLLMAARKGCIEIVKETVDRFPHAVYYLNRNRGNFLHVAIKTRNIEIYDYVNKNVPLLQGLKSALDNDNNSILHMVGCPRKVQLDTKMKSPVLQLSDDLRLLKSLKMDCPSYLQYHRNNQMKTADELSAEKNEELRKEGKEWLRKTSEHSTVVIILIATVAFAAAYTVPGGSDEKTGYPVLLKRPLFLVFTVTDWVCFDSRGSFSSNNNVILSVERLPKISSKSTVSGFYPALSLGYNDDGSICCNYYSHGE